MTTKNTLLFFLLLTFFSCKEKEVLPMNGEIDIAPPFQPYVDEFIAEAAKRGIPIDFSDTGLSMQFSALPLGTAAQCMEFGDDRRGSHQIEFDENLWMITAPERRAFLVFHELGHCELNRPHHNEQLSNSEWQTIMQGFIPDEPFLGKNIGRPVVFYGYRKDYYLDELFGLSPSEPDWVNFKTNYDAISTNQKEQVFNILNVWSLQKTFELNDTNYELEIILKRQKEAGDIGIRYGTLDKSYLFKLTNANQLLIEKGGKVASEIEFYNGGNVILTVPYRLFFCNNLLLGNTNPKVTIRQQNGIATFFLNEQFLFHIEELTAKNILVGGIQNNDNLLIETFTLSRL